MKKSVLMKEAKFVFHNAVKIPSGNRSELYDCHFFVSKKFRRIFMPSNKRESFVYTLIMCFVMVFWMSLYNISLQEGQFSLNVLKTGWLGLPLGYCCALILDWFIVSTTAKKVAFKLIPTSATPLRKVLTISCCMVLPMVFFMSLYGSIEVLSHTHEWNKLFIMWGTNILKNLVMALPFQLMIAGPFVRKIFRRIFPVGTILA